MRRIRKPLQQLLLQHDLHRTGLLLVLVRPTVLGQSAVVPQQVLGAQLSRRRRLSLGAHMRRLRDELHPDRLTGSVPRARRLPLGVTRT
jgi:hypothetical protein